jgi:hypothetical protein
VFRPRVPADALALVAAILDYTPSNRVTAFRALAHEFFDELRNPATTYEGKLLVDQLVIAYCDTLIAGQPLPALFDFTADGKIMFFIPSKRDNSFVELSIDPAINERILPASYLAVASENLRRAFEAEL